MAIWQQLTFSVIPEDCEILLRLSLSILAASLRIS
jgi:hypothetical protein